MKRISQFVLVTAISLLAVVSYAEVRSAPIKVACIGDSITAGFGMPEEKRQTHSYPAVLGRLLGDNYQVTNFGISGRTMLREEPAAWINSSYPRKLEELVPDIITMKLGTNDSKMKHWENNKETYESDLKTFIAEFRQINPKVKIYLCLPVPAFDLRTKELSTGDGISGTRIFNEIIPIIQKVAKDEGLPIIDLQTPLVTHIEYFSDGVHPNEAGAEAIAQLIYEQIHLGGE